MLYLEDITNHKSLEIFTIFKIVKLSLGNGVLKYQIFYSIQKIIKNLYQIYILIRQLFLIQVLHKYLYHH
jgi:hypothetical protein